VEEDATEELEEDSEEAVEEESTEEIAEDSEEAVEEDATEELEEDSEEAVEEESTEEIAEDSEEAVEEDATEELEEDSEEAVEEESTEEIAEDSEEAVEEDATEELEEDSEEAVEEDATEEIAEETSEEAALPSSDEINKQLKPVYFDTDKFNIRANQVAVLDKAIAIIKANPHLKVIAIAGNCDERGTSKYNLALSARRAQTVKQYFINHGIDGSQIVIFTFGEAHPAKKGHNEGAWKFNRRVDIQVWEDVVTEAQVLQTVHLD
jgi:outer membrane protein OmpA-like peptidoglycan-associated protein